MAQLLLVMVSDFNPQGSLSCFLPLQFSLFFSAKAPPPNPSH